MALDPAVYLGPESHAGPPVLDQDFIAALKVPLELYEQ